MGKLCRDLSHQPLPVAGSRLPEETHGGIPRCVGALEHPAPIWIVRQQHPHGIAQRSRKMSHRSAHRYEQVQRGQRGVGIAELRRFGDQSVTSTASFNWPKSAERGPTWRLKNWVPGRLASGARLASRAERVESSGWRGLPAHTRPMRRMAGRADAVPVPRNWAAP